MITLTIQLVVDGRAENMSIDSLRPGDFATGAGHILHEYLEPMSEMVMHAYQKLSAENVPGIREQLDERESISRRLARIGMV